MAKQKVIVGMSGGVDSSVTVHLLQKQGYEVIGVNLCNWTEMSDHTGNATDMSKTEETGAASDTKQTDEPTAVSDAKKVADSLGIPFYTYDTQNIFKRNIVDYFTAEYLSGRTPNPCVRCNPQVKWASLLHMADEVGADFVATGHYARVQKLENGRYAICRASCKEKDQSYALYGLSQEQLARTILPLGTYTKEEIRKIAGKMHLPVAKKPDSQEICFIPDNDYAAFLERQAPSKIPAPGNFVAKDGTVLGTHKGIHHYTIGQRKGLGLAFGHPVFVREIRPDTNEVVIGENEDIFTKKLLCTDVKWMGIAAPEKPVSASAKIRYGHAGAPCTLIPQENDKVECAFDEPVRAATPGQSVVFYDSEVVLGGGTII